MITAILRKMAPPVLAIPCGNVTCDTACTTCDHHRGACVAKPCDAIVDLSHCPATCPQLSSETLLAVGAVVLCLVAVLLAMTMWHWRRCGERRTT